jgi:23S rRNA (guanosine2251-2'-O)-methyltransferase
VVPNIPRAVEGLKKAGFWVYGADMGGGSAWNFSLKGKVAIVLGAEGRGIGRLVRERCDEIISIPSRGHIDSFNVSVAGGILLYECRRQQWSD